MESTSLIKYLCASADDLLRAPATDNTAATQQRLDEAAEMLNLASRIVARNATPDAKFDRRAA